MRHDIVLAGVGGQGILTIARVLLAAATAKGLHVKQAELHGMSQRGGAVNSHVRISETEIFSDLIPRGQADLILSVEPLEALRYAPMLRPDGALVTNSRPMVNIGDYPPIEQVLEHIGEFGRHVAFDTDRLARSAGSPLASNIAALGAASPFLQFTPEELEAAVAGLFETKPQRIREANTRAFQFGRLAATAYLEAIRAGKTPHDARERMDAMSPEELASVIAEPL